MSAAVLLGAILILATSWGVSHPLTFPLLKVTWYGLLAPSLDVILPRLPLTITFSPIPMRPVGFGTQLSGEAIVEVGGTAPPKVKGATAGAGAGSAPEGAGAAGAARRRLGWRAADEPNDSRATGRHVTSQSLPVLPGSDPRRPHAPSW